MTDADREHLRRIIYGPNATPQERAAAEEALRESDERALAASVVPIEEPEGDQQKLAQVGDEILEPENADDSAECSDEPSLWRRRIRVGWLVPIAVASLLVGAVGALGVTGHLSGIMATMFSDGGAVVKGDLKAADSRFDKPFVPSDTYPGIVAQSYGVGESDVRASGLAGVWFGRTDSTLCLLLLSFEAGSGASCVQRDHFVKSGITLVSMGHTFRWFGGDATVDPPLAAGQNSVSPTPAQWSGPGNVDAANAWFDKPGAAQEPFPTLWMLDQMGVNQSQVRLAGINDRGYKLWIVKQGATGFCLAGYDVNAGEARYQCATIAKFEASGVSIAAPNFAAWWDGVSLSMSG